jgi:hypothetical protein
VYLDQVLRLPLLEVEVLVKVLRGALERSYEVADVSLLARRHAG